MRVFRGIRYGEAERFSSPTMASALEGTTVLDDFGSACAQPIHPFGSPSNEEDCLFLNVYAPEAPGDYPVMLWIHGGALLAGDGGRDYAPDRLVERDVVVVTINYRLGSLGFLPHSAIGDSNFGLQDQQLAMQWVQDNISTFDGNPDLVTIFGESAGGHSVLSHLASPGASGLFHRAIVQSGSYNGNQMPLKLDPTSLNGIPPDQAYDGETRIGEPIVQRIRELAPEACSNNIDLLDCLKGAPLSAILDAQKQILEERQIESILPVWDPESELLPRSINQALGSGSFHKVPVLMGSNLDEGDLFMLLATASRSLYSEPEYISAVQNLLKEDASLDSAAIATHYLERARQRILQEPLKSQLASYDNTYLPLIYPYLHAYSLIITDWRFNCPNDRQWALLAEEVDTYGYWFADKDSSKVYRQIRLMEGADFPDPFPLGASHAFELPYLLNTQAVFDSAGATEAQQQLSANMLDYWTNFAKYGDPNHTDGSTEPDEWPRYTNNGDIFRLETPEPNERSINDFRDTHNCSFWDNLLRRQDPT